MAIELEKIILKAMRATHCSKKEILQSLWSGYGSIIRYNLIGSDPERVIAKHVSPPNSSNHPRGWDTNHSHQRKLKSYQVESRWYQDYSKLCNVRCLVPQCYAVAQDGDEIVILLEDLDSLNYRKRCTSVSQIELHACLRWLAEFHVTFLESSCEGLWESGTYWHLDTRPDELKKLKFQDPELHSVAHTIDTKLKASPFQTLVHGDAKLANFCFSQDGESVAAVDFQYVGRGCGIKDIAYFISSCFGEEECELQSPALLDFYFSSLRSALDRQNKIINPDALEANWRFLYPYAWADFYRFLKGWSPDHWKIHSYSERLTQKVICSIKS